MDIVERLRFLESYIESGEARTGKNIFKEAAAEIDALRLDNERLREAVGEEQIKAARKAAPPFWRDTSDCEKHIAKMLNAALATRKAKGAER